MNHDNWSLADDVTLYVEQHAGTSFGTLHHYRQGNKAYLNHDMAVVVEHVASGLSLDSLFPASFPEIERQEAIKLSQERLEQLSFAGFLRTPAAATSGRMKLVSVEPPLRVLFLETTKRCNLFCRHCYVHDGPDVDGSPQLSTPETLNIIGQADGLGVMEIQLTGGEFFILRDSLRILQDVQDRHIPCSVFTNGTLIRAPLLDYLKEHHHGLIFYISLDGPAEVHDAFRGSPGAFRRTCSAVKHLLQAGCDVRLNTCVGSHNYAAMPQFMDFVSTEFGVLHRLVQVEPLGRAKDDLSLAISNQDFALLVGTRSGKVEFLDSHDEVSAHDLSVPPCGVGQSLAFVDAYGNVSLCPTMTQHEHPSFIAGSTRRNSLRDIWTSGLAFQAYRGIQCQQVTTCSARDQCKGGCRSHAFLATGDASAPDPGMCSVFHIG